MIVCFLCTLVVGITCCDGIDGTEGSRCYPNHTCDGDLLCYSFGGGVKGTCYPPDPANHLLPKK